MAVLILGLALWWCAHLFKRVAPRLRAKLGNRGKALVALGVAGSIIVMVVGYRSADGAVFWPRSSALVGINSLLMVIAFYLYAVGGAQGPRVWIGTKLRHPQLIGFSIWCLAHLLVTGDVASFVLFGGLLGWALVEMALINVQDGAWTPPPRAPRPKEVIFGIAALAIFGIIMFVHNWLGVQPWV